VEVVVKDVDAAVLQRCVSYVRKELERRGRGAEARRLSTTLRYEDLARADCAIEAAPEVLELKRQIFGELMRVGAPHCVLASNTSSLPLERIAADNAPLARRLVGSHYFNPPSVMRLLELVRTPATDPQHVVDWLAFARSLVRMFFVYMFLFFQMQNKVAIVVRSCVGFAANRMFFPYSACAAWLVAEQGLSPYALDAALRRFGIPIGPFALADLVGLDVGVHVGVS
jgi:3-hydroxyacyl-CoA dehydrogenase